MRTSPRVSRMLLIAASLPWAAAWVVLGLWLIAEPTPGIASSGAMVLPPMLRWTVGITSIAAGQLVFMCFVADRIFPGASRAAVWTAEIATCGVVFLGVLVLLGLFLAGVPRDGGA